MACRAFKESAFLAETDLKVADPAASMRALKAVGVPYTDEQIELASADLEAQADDFGDSEGLESRYPKSQTRDFDGNPDRLTEMDALVAYLQMLGTLVDVNKPAAQEQLAEETGR